MSRYDSPWKEVIYQHLRLVLLLLFPKLAARIDWSQETDPLEAELRKLAPESDTGGTRFADALVRVTFLTGDERILHFEVQAQPDDLPFRTYVYNYRAHDQLLIPPESLVILGDADPKWKPTSYIVERDYSRLVFEFEPVKLLDWRGREEELLQHENPMGLVVLAHLESLRTGIEDEERGEVKLALLLNLARRKLNPDDERQFFRYLDWLLRLPHEVNRRVYEERTRILKENDVPFIDIAEMTGIEKGIAKGLQEAAELGLELKFGADGLTLMEQVRQINDLDRLRAILAKLKTTASFDELRQAVSLSANGAN